LCPPPPAGGGGGGGGVWGGGLGGSQRADARNSVGPHMADVKERANNPREGFLDNKTVFGGILRGELPAQVLYEDDDVLCFRDISPASELHLLVIPKRFIENVHGLRAHRDDIALVEHMVEVSKKVVSTEHPQLDVEAALQSNRLSLGFHRWPMISVRHLHLHCIYPMPAASWWKSFLHPQHYSMLYVSARDVIATLQRDAKKSSL
jgi:histidine triad (HIT) family protein